MITEKAYAKLNLNLHILPHKMVNGFYDVCFLNCELDLHDELIFEPINSEIKIIAKDPDLPEIHHNLIYKAGQLIKEMTGKKNLGAKITLFKNIPVRAGLGGGSSDANAAIKGLMQLWGIDLNKESLYKIADKLGKDVFYFLEGGLSKVIGDGREVHKLSFNIPVFWLIIITPDIQKPSTGWMYKQLDTNKIGKHIDRFDKLLNAIKIRRVPEILKNLHNDFESTVSEHFPITKKIKKDLEKTGAIKSLVAGSGLSMVGFYEEKEKRDLAFEKLKGQYKNIICTKTR